MRRLGAVLITPSTVTGQEQEKQAVAPTFADVLQRERAGLRTLRELLERTAHDLVAKLP